jgi:preprotein translocase subunit SecB
VDDSGEPIEGALFDLLVELMGVFEVVNDDPESGFNVEFIKQWARENAPMILYPYVREQMYGLTSRAGYSGVILPLMELPTIKFPSPTEARSS